MGVRARLCVGWKYNYLPPALFVLAFVLSGVQIVTSLSSHHHINVCHFIPTDEELDEIVQQQTDQEDVNEYSHKVITIKKYTAREHILISILENEADEPHRFMYLAQAVVSSGKPIGHFKSFDEQLPMRKCDDKQVFYNDQSSLDSGEEPLRGGVTFEWVAPNTKARETVTVIVTKVNMNLLHRHRNQNLPHGEEEAEEETTGHRD